MKVSEKTEGLLNWSDLRTARGKATYGLIMVYAIVLAAICLLPVVWMFLSSFKTPEEMYAVPPVLFPDKIDFASIKKIFEKAKIEKYLFNTLCIIVGCVVADITVNGLAGYVLAKIRPLGTKLFNTLLFWTMMLPGISMVPLYMTFVDFPIGHFNMLGTFLPLWMMSATNAFNIFLFRNFFNGIPEEYLDAAKIDGCSNVGVFIRIMLPLSSPIVTCVAIFGVIGAWGNFFWPYLILGDTDLEPISVMLYKLGNYSTFLANEKMMLLMFATIPSIIVFAIFSKKIMGGLNMSGIKG